MTRHQKLRKLAFLYAAATVAAWAIGFPHLVVLVANLAFVACLYASKGGDAE